MPAYEYSCGSCGQSFVQRQKMSDAELTACPGCGGRVKRLISGGAGAITRGANTAAAPGMCGSGGAGCGAGIGCGAAEMGCGLGACSWGN